MIPICDLHTHSYYSDGTYSPTQLIKAAEKEGLSAIALCDHNTVAGLPEFLAAAENCNVEAVPGIEFTTDYRGTELHILALYIKKKHYPAITELLQDFRLHKERSNIELVARLRQAGLNIDYDSIKAAAKDGYVNRAHIAAELVCNGYTESVKDGFQKYLSVGGGFYTPPQQLDAFEVIRFIKSIGAAAVLAHPFLNLNEEQMRVFLPLAKAHGLDAMETLYTKYDEETTNIAAKIAEEFGLEKSGGSDFHGDNKPGVRLGCGTGNLLIPLRFLEIIKKRVSTSRGASIE